jgi:Rad3-related DNA helicase
MNDPEFEYHFPFKVPRKIQRFITRRLYQIFKTHKYVLLQAPTGIGKSPIAYTLASYLDEIPLCKNVEKKGAYILTSMKGLQDQYMKDYSELTNKSLNTVKGKNNYRCQRDSTISCETGGCTKRNAPDHDTCPYICDRQLAYESDMSVLNYSYFMNMTHEPSIQERKQLLVLDECHNVEGQLLKFASVNIKRSDFKDLNLSLPKLPSLKATNYEMIKWLEDKFLKAIKSMDSSIQIDMEGICEGDIEYNHLKQQHVFLTNMTTMVERLKSQRIRGVTIVVDRDGHDFIAFKPLKADLYAKDFLFSFAEKVLMMSATVMDPNHYCTSLGLDPKEVFYLEIPCPFPVERRPIINCAKYRLNKANMETYKYEIAEQVKDILETHKDERGVIHSQSYELAEFLVAELKDPRLHIPRGMNRDEDIRSYLNDPLVSNGVIISPSIKEGFDFKDDYARFCILLKAPYANLGDSFVKKRQSEDPKWYYMEALRDIVQSTGRVVRHDKDYAVTYLLDQNIMRLAIDNKRFISDWLDAVKTADYKWNPDKFKDEK